MKEQDKCDAVDKLIGQWGVERPELNTSAMATIGRLKRCMALIKPKLEKVYAEFSLASWEFDVLATLLRSGSPYCLAPTELYSSLMITSGTITNRMNRLEARGLVTRITNTKDARSKLLQLSPEGIELIDRAVEAHVHNETSILSSISDECIKELDSSLKSLLISLEGK